MSKEEKEKHTHVLLRNSKGNHVVLSVDEARLRRPKGYKAIERLWLETALGGRIDGYCVMYRGAVMKVIESSPVNQPKDTVAGATKPLHLVLWEKHEMRWANVRMANDNFVQQRTLSSALAMCEANAEASNMCWYVGFRKDAYPDVSVADMMALAASIQSATGISCTAFHAGDESEEFPHGDFISFEFKIKKEDARK